MQSGPSAVAFVHCAGSGIKRKLFNSDAVQCGMNADGGWLRIRQPSKCTINNS